jgi:uncharacterized RDD family membrane protein YckC
MIDPLACPTCSFANPLGAESCVKCGAALAEIPERVHPGETLRDPDDLTLPAPPSPLLRAVLRGQTDVPAARPAARETVPTVAPPLPSVTAVAAPQPAPSVPPPFPPEPAPVAPAMTRAAIEQLSPGVDQAELLRELAERLHARKVEPAPIRYAGFLVRTAAFVIDGVVLAAFGVLLAMAGYTGIRAGMLAIGQTSPIDVDETLLTPFIAAWFAMATVYFTVLHRTYGQTIGKSLLRIRVHTIDLGEVGYLRAFLRTVCYAASSSFLGFGFWLVALTPRKRGWHDFLAGTCVVRLAGDEAAS